MPGDVLAARAQRRRRERAAAVRRRHAARGRPRRSRTTSSKKPQALDGSSVVVNGKLEKTGDVDCFAVTLKKGQTLVAVARGAPHAPLADGRRCCKSSRPTASSLDENNDYRGLDPQTRVHRPEGRHLRRPRVRLPRRARSSIRSLRLRACVYRLTLTTGAFADYAVPLALRGRDDWDKDKFEVKGWNIRRRPVAVPDSQSWRLRHSFAVLARLSREHPSRPSGRSPLLHFSRSQS